MEPKIKSSFIPKTPVSSSSPAPRTRRGGSLLFALSLMVFLAAFIGWGGVVGYNIYLERTIQDKSVRLEAERAAFAPALIEELRRLDIRFTVAEQLLNAHSAPSILFDILSRVTLRTVQFDTLEYTWLPDGRVALTLDGTARNFASLALQSDAFDIEPSIREPIFSDFGLDEFGNVTFVAQMQINPLALSYVDFVARTGAGSIPDEAANIPVETIGTSTEGVGETVDVGADQLSEGELP